MTHQLTDALVAILDAYKENRLSKDDALCLLNNLIEKEAPTVIPTIDYPIVPPVYPVIYYTTITSDSSHD